MTNYKKNKKIESRKRKYLGSINSTVNTLVKKAKENLKDGYNQIVIDKGKSFHDPSVRLWMVKGTNNICRLESLYRKAVMQSIELYGLSRKSEQGKDVYASFVKKIHVTFSVPNRII